MQWCYFAEWKLLLSLLYFRWNISDPEQYALQHTDTMSYITEEVSFCKMNERGCIYHSIHTFNVIGYHPVLPC